MSDKPIIDPNTGRPLQFAPRYTVEGLDIAATLITDSSRRRLKTILKAQELTNKGDIPDKYTIPYYLPIGSDQPVSKTLVQVFSIIKDDGVHSPQNGKNKLKPKPYIHDGNTPQQLNSNMLKAVLDSFRAIEEQLPGRFEFVQVWDSDKALLNFAAVPSMHKLGVANIDTGSILFNASKYQGAYSAEMTSTALHEIGHGLGLEHPHQFEKGKGGPSTDKATYLDTVMSYNNNKNSEAVGVYLSPVSLMPGDAQALIRLYRIKNDATAQENNLVQPILTEYSPNFPFTVVLEQKGQEDITKAAVKLANQGLIYQPAADTSQDTIRFEYHSWKAGAVRIKDGDGIERTYHSQIRQYPNFITVSSPYNKAITSLPIYAEKVVLSKGPETYVGEGGANIYSTANEAMFHQKDHGHIDEIYISGRNNRISISAKDLESAITGIFIRTGSQVTIQLRDGDMLNSGSRLAELARVNFGKMTGAPKPVGVWKDNHDGTFDLRIIDTSAKRPVPVEIKFELENPTEQKIEMVRKLISRGFYGIHEKETKEENSIKVTYTNTPYFDVIENGTLPDMNKEQPARTTPSRKLGKER